MCTEKFYKINRKTFLPESFFNKVAGPKLGQVLAFEFSKHLQFSEQPFCRTLLGDYTAVNFSKLPEKSISFSGHPRVCRGFSIFLLYSSSVSARSLSLVFCSLVFITVVFVFIIILVYFLNPSCSMVYLAAKDCNFFFVFVFLHIIHHFIWTFVAIFLKSTLFIKKFASEFKISFVYIHSNWVWIVCFSQYVIISLAGMECKLDSVSFF